MKILRPILLLIASVMILQTGWASIVTNDRTLNCAATSGSATMQTSRIRSSENVMSPDLLNVITIVWTSTSGGKTLFTVPGVWGEIRRVTFSDDSATSPTNAYDVTAKDADGIDVLGGGGADLSNVNPKTFTPMLYDTNGTTTTKAVVGGDLTWMVLNAGSIKKGKIRIYLKL